MSNIERNPEWNGPFKINSSEIKYSNKWIKVREDLVERNKKEGLWGIVTASTGALVLPIDDEGNVYLVDSFRYALRRNSTELPGGVVDSDETPLNAATRELREELGLESEEIIDIGTEVPYGSYIEGTNYLYIAKGVKKTKQEELDEGEQIVLEKVPFETAFKWVMEGKITHGGTQIAILKAKYLLNL